jgi:hypothetical protein
MPSGEEIDMFGPNRRVARRTARRTTRRVDRRRALLDPEPAYEEPPPAAPATDPTYVAELEQLATLKSRGLITDEEYEAKKKQILGI